MQRILNMNTITEKLTQSLKNTDDIIIIENIITSFIDYEKDESFKKGLSAGIELITNKYLRENTY